MTTLTDDQKAYKAWAWAKSLTPKQLHGCIYTLSVDIDAYTPAERKALLQVATQVLGKLKDS
jgi:hypothetical protein